MKKVFNSGAKEAVTGNSSQRWRPLNWLLDSRVRKKHLYEDVGIRSSTADRVLWAVWQVWIWAWAVGTGVRGGDEEQMRDRLPQEGQSILALALGFKHGSDWYDSHILSQGKACVFAKYSFLKYCSKWRNNNTAQMLKPTNQPLPSPYFRTPDVNEGNDSGNQEKRMPLIVTEKKEHSWNCGQSAGRFWKECEEKEKSKLIPRV